MMPSSGTVISYHSSQNSGKHFYLLLLVNIRDIIRIQMKDKDEEGVHRARSRKVLSAGASVLVEFAAHLSLYVRMHSPPWKLSVKLLCLGSL